MEYLIASSSEVWGDFALLAVHQYSNSSTQLLAIFDALREWFEEPDFRDCAFINATVELANPDCSVHRVALQHQQLIYRYILSLAQSAEILSPEKLARQLLLLVQGASVVAILLTLLY